MEKTRWVRFLDEVSGEVGHEVIIIVGTHRRATEIRTELRIPKKRTPPLPAGVPRLYEG